MNQPPPIPVAVVRAATAAVCKAVGHWAHVSMGKPREECNEGLLAMPALEAVWPLLYAAALRDAARQLDDTSADVEFLHRLADRAAHGWDDFGAAS